MKVYFTLHEGGKWHETNLSRKELNAYLRIYTYQALKNYRTIGALKSAKCPIIYDFVLLKLKNQPWIRNQYNGTR